MSQFNRQKKIARLHSRIRRKVVGTAQRPRLCVHFSGSNIYAQVIDDGIGRTLASASTLDKDYKGKKAANTESSQKVGALIAERAKKASVESVVFDRGGYQYHGKVKALAEAAREGGLQF